MKLKRTRKDYGSGSGRTFFEGNLFRVVHWYCQDRKFTELEYNMGYHFNIKIKFPGLHDELNSDEKCMEQLRFKEIVEIIEHEKNIAFERGKEVKSKEILKCLGLDLRY